MVVRNVDVKEYFELVGFSTYRYMEYFYLADDGIEVLHRDESEGPAFVQRVGDFVKLEVFFKDGKKHRESGPAQVSYSPHGTRVIMERYFLEGEELTEEMWRLRIDPLYKELI